MKFLFIFTILLFSINAADINGYATVGIVSHHFDTNNGKSFNEDHKAIGVELLINQNYALSYLHFDNSRNKSTNIYAIGYRYDLYGPFGIYAVAGYQNGYCFDGLKSVECTEGRDNSSFTFLPMFYYKHNYFILDLILHEEMIALKLNLKIF